MIDYSTLSAISVADDLKEASGLTWPFDRPQCQVPSELIIQMSLKSIGLSEMHPPPSIHPIPYDN